MRDIIIVKKDLVNAYTGEVEEYEFRGFKSSKIKGGFIMTYKSFFEILPNVITSSLDLKIALEIVDNFTYMQVEVALKASKIAKKFDTSTNKVTLLIKKMVEQKLLCRVDRGIYRLNPFMYLPYRADGQELQKEWVELCKK